MSVLLRSSALFFLLSTPAMACEIDGCVLPETLHQIDGKDSPTHGVWTWLHHDLALARRAMRADEDAKALDLAHTLDRILRRRIRDLISFGGPEAVKNFHAALQSVVLNAGGWPLAEIDVVNKEASG